MLTRKDKLLLAALGRKTTPYDAAKKFGENVSDLGKLGPWYACKKELVNEKLIKEMPEEGRDKPIMADTAAYMQFVIRNDKAARILASGKAIKVFEKYAPRFVDLVINLVTQFPEAEGSGVPLVKVPLFGFLFITFYSADQERARKKIESLPGDVSQFFQVFKNNEHFEALLSDENEAIGASSIALDFYKDFALKFTEEEKEELSFLNLYSKIDLMNLSLAFLRSLNGNIVKSFIISILESRAKEKKP
jgi:hypothetical protein